MSKFFCNGADAECSCPILCADCESADWTGGTEIKTNADHIRSMTDEELAERNVRETITHVENGQSGYYANAWQTSDGTVFASRGHAVGYELHWLKQPYKEVST